MKFLDILIINIEKKDRFMNFIGYISIKYVKKPIFLFIYAYFKKELRFSYSMMLI